MSRKNFVQALEYSEAMGLDTTSPLPLMDSGYTRKATNCDLGSTGGYAKRDGYTSQLTSDWTGYSIKQGIEFKTTAVAAEKVVFGTDGNSAGGVLGKVTAGAVVDIKTGLDEDARPSLFQFKDLLFFYNGDSVNSPFLYDGTTTRRIGINEPLTAPTKNSDIAGSLLTGQNYIYAFTFYNSATEAESSPSPLTASLTTATGGIKLDLDMTEHDSSTADKIRIYRTVANGNTLFLEEVIAAPATTHDSDISDASLSATQVEFDNSTIDDFDTTPEYPVVAQNRVFLKTGDNEVRFSKIGQSGPMPESFEAKSFVVTQGKHGSRDDIIGLAQIKDIPLVLKELSIGRLDQVGIQDYTTSVDNVAFIYRELSTNVGAVSHFGGVQVYDEYVFLGRDGVYACNGSSIRPVADAIESTVKSLSFIPEHRAKISAVNDQDNKRIYISVVPSFVEGKVSTVLVGDYEQYPNFRWTTYEEGSNATTHPGIVPGCFFNVENTTNGSVEIWFGNDAFNGKLYRMNDGTNDDGSGIHFEVHSRPYSFGQPIILKLYKYAQIFAEARDNSYDLTVCSIYELNGVIDNCVQLTLPASGSFWALNADPELDDNWVDDPETESDPFVWAGEDIDPLTYHQHKKAHFQQLVFKQLDADAPIALYGWGTSASIQGPIVRADVDRGEKA